MAFILSKLRAMIAGALALLLLLQPALVIAQAVDQSDKLTAAQTIDRARELIKAGLYDTAIQQLQEVLERIRPDFASLRTAYLLTIYAYVVKGNEYINSNEIVTAKSLHNQAKDVIRECLLTPGLRNTGAAAPGLDRLPKMEELFAEVRSQIFGTFEISKLNPPNAVAILNGDTLKVLPERSNRVGEVNLKTGRYMLVIQSPGFRTQTHPIDIGAGQSVVSDYSLKKNTGTRTWILRGVVAGVLGGAVAALAGWSKTEAAQPLPGPPDPPSN